MSLDDLLKPLKFADEEILTKYSRLAKWWEDKGHSIYSLTAPIGFLSTVPFVKGLYGISPSSPPQGIIMCMYSFLFSADNTLNLWGITHFYDKERIIDNSVVHENHVIEVARKMVRILRLPTFVAGGFFMMKSGYDLFEYISHGNSHNINEFVVDLNFAIGLMGQATSMYLKDSDPKLLDKEPLWKRACESLREFVSYTPAPQPIPIPIPPRN